MSAAPRTWVVQVDRDVCLGTGVCCFYAPATFDLDEEGRSFVVDQDGDPDEAVRNAVEACPTRALLITERAHSSVPPMTSGDERSAT
jgi:ferredoxin